MIEVDALFRSLGNPGRYHVCVYFLLCLNYFPIAFNHLAMMVFKATPSYHCHSPETNYHNETTVRTDYGKLGQCFIYANSSDEKNSSSIRCQNGWDYKPAYPRENTIVMEVISIFLVTLNE